MTRAYDEVLLPGARNTLGRMLDFSVHSLRMDAHAMMELFTATGIADRFGCGEIRMIAGMSGIELAYEVLDRSGLPYERVSPRHGISLSPEYWLGHACALMQWQSGISFDEICRSLDERGFTAEYVRGRTACLEKLPLDISEAERVEALRDFGRKFAREAAANFASQAAGRDASASMTADAATGAQPPTRLKQMRIKNGLSQSELAKASGIPVRTIQQYEQRQKDINKARFEYIVSLSAALNCEASMLLEHRCGDD